MRLARGVKHSGWLGGLLLSLAALLLPAHADAPARSPVVRATATRATPAYWRVTGKRGTAYLFGSVHILPPAMDWRTPALDKAIKSADIFAFEIPNDQDTLAKTRDVIIARGTLPPGENLRAMLPADAQADFDAVSSMAQVSPDMLHSLRPWLADLMLSVSLFQKLAGASPLSGADMVLAREATSAGKELRYMETAQQQLELIAPDDPKLELEQFEYDLKEMRSQPQLVPQLVDIWSRGDMAALDAMFSKSMNDHPEARKAMLDDRNAAWVVKLKPWLDDEKKVFFVTVGAGHLVGAKGVPALLRAAGYKVEGPLH